MNKEEAYPPLDAYTSISCNSSYTIICFILSFFAIAFYHVRASFYICYEYDEDYSGDVSTNQRFQYIQMIGKFTLTVLSTMFCSVPFVPLSLNLIIFALILIAVICIPCRAAFSLEHSRLYISLYTVQVMTALMALLSQIFSSSSSVFSLITICLIPFGFIFGCTFKYAPSLNNSYFYDSLSRMMLNKDEYVRLIISKVVIDEFYKIYLKEYKISGKENNEFNDTSESNNSEKEKKYSKYQKKEEKDNNKDKDKKTGTSSLLERLKRELFDFIALGSIFHRGLSSRELIKNAGNILLEYIRKNDDEYNYYCSDEKQEANYINVYRNDNKIKNREEFKKDVVNTLSLLEDYECEYFKVKKVTHSKNIIVSLSIFELSSLILVRDNYIRGKTEDEITINSNLKYFDIPELLEESLKSTSENIISNNDSLLDRINNSSYLDCLLYCLYYPNSLTISLPPFLYKFIHIYFSYLFFDFSNLFLLYSFLLLSQSFLFSFNRMWKCEYNFSYFYLLGINIKECMTILLSHLKISGSIIFTSDFDNDDNYNREEEKLFEGRNEIGHLRNHLNEEIYIDYTIRILSLLSSLFKDDWRLCAFFVTFVNDKTFVDTFKNNYEYIKSKEKMKIKKIFETKKNDLWLLNKTDGICDWKYSSDRELYLEFECNEYQNIRFVEHLKKKRKIL